MRQPSDFIKPPKSPTLLLPPRFQHCKFPFGSRSRSRSRFRFLPPFLSHTLSPSSFFIAQDRHLRAAGQFSSLQSQTQKNFTNTKKIHECKKISTHYEESYSIEHGLLIETEEEAQTKTKKKVGEEENEKERWCAMQRYLVKCYRNFIQATKITLIKG